MELLRFYAWVFVSLTENLLTLERQLKEFEGAGWLKVVVGKSQWRYFQGWKSLLTSAKQECERTELVLSAKHCQETLELLERKQLRSTEINALIQTVSRELSSHVFLSVPYVRRDFYAQPVNDWEAIVAAFPDAQEDIEEMNKCFALSRYTASVFHSLLVVEHGLIRLGHHIGVTDPKPGWDATYKRLTWLLNNRASVPADLDFNFLEQSKARLDSMKLAWRNKVNHAAGKLMIEKTGFTDFAAEEIIVACRSFMRHLAEGLL